jgi:hypothetical protein
LDPESAPPTTGPDQSDPSPRDTPAPPKRKSRSKIALLPRELRDLVNNLLADGATGPEVAQKLAAHGVSLNVENISNWYRGPHQLWLAEQRLLEESRLRHELTLDLAREAPGTDAFQGAHKLAAALICEAVAELGAPSLREAIKNNPLNLLRMLNTLSRLTAGGVKCERLLADEADRKAKLELHRQNGSARKKGMTPKTLSEVKDELNLM